MAASKMLAFLHSECVVFECSCGLRNPLRLLYFCRHCLKLRCKDCVSHEVDTHYCPNCLENMPSAEARLKKNLCANCFDCPSCNHTLSTRASSIQVPSPEDASKTIPKKVYYLACGCCRWTSRDINLKDQPVASGAWPEPENAHGKRISLLLEHYRALAQKEKIDRDKWKYPKRRGYFYLSDKLGLTASMAKKKAGLPSFGNLSLKDNDSKPLEITPSEAMIEEPEPLSNEFLMKPVELPQVCTINQRHSQPECQPSYTKDMCPGHKHLQSKQSHRCRDCEHNLSKPEYNPTSIKFKIQFNAFYHIPQVKIMTIPNFVTEMVSSLVITLCNPSQYPCHIYLLPLDKDQNDPLITANIRLPSAELLLSPHDDAAEFDDVTESKPACKGDPSAIAFQKANKVGIIVKVTPKKGEGKVHIAFRLKWDYHHTAVAAQGDTKESQTVWMDTRIDMHLGPINSQ